MRPLLVWAALILGTVVQPLRSSQLRGAGGGLLHGGGDSDAVWRVNTGQPEEGARSTLSAECRGVPEAMRPGVEAAQA